MSPLRATGLSAMVALFAACAPPAIDREVLATYSGGEITSADLDRHILTLPTGQRRPEDGDFASWHEKLIRELAFQRLLLAAARRAGADQEAEFLDREGELERRAMMTLYVEHHPPTATPLTDDQVRAAYELSRDEYRQPARRKVYHLFRRYGPGNDRDRLQLEVAELRARVVAGESFSELAAAHSDSELRHRGGLLGWVRSDQLAAELAPLVFDLEVGVPSPPLRTAEGIHLFWVESAFPDKQYSFDEVRAVVTQKLRQERQERYLADLADAVELPDGSYVPEPEELATLLASGGRRALMLRVGDFELRVEDFRQRLLESAARSGEMTPELPQQLIDSLVRRERIYLRAQAEGLGDDAELAELIERLRQAELVSFYLRERLQQEALLRTEQLAEYFERHRQRYAEPLRLHLKRLRIPLTDRAFVDMTRLEAQAEDLATGRVTLEDLAVELGGETQDLGWQTARSLRTTDPTAASLALDLEIGEVSPPFRSREHLEMVELLERSDPQPLAFEQVEEQVIQDFLIRHGREIYAELEAELLEQGELRILQGRLEEIHQG